jgi:hypothetical protein
MTIAACYLSSEGVVFGADSTATFSNRYYDHAQKIFEVGSRGSTLGIVIWGLGSLGELSHRTWIMQFAEHNQQQATASVQEIAIRLAQFFWPQYQSRLAPQILRFQQLAAQAQLNPQELKERQALFDGLSGGFCFGGNLQNDRTPHAFMILYNPAMTVPIIQPLPQHLPMFWGQPNLIQRLAAGIDEDLFRDILQSGRWNGTQDDLLGLINRRRLFLPGILPIREAIDLIHASLYSTIKTMKFSQLAPVCGGPVEIAVITSDRAFRWVRHKKFDTAIPYGESLNGKDRN